MGCGGRTGSGARDFSDRQGFAFGVWEAEALGGLGESGDKGSGGEGYGRGPRRARSTAPPEFVEFMTSQATGLSECLIELEGRRGKMRIQWKGTTAPDLSGLSRALWESR